MADVIFAFNLADDSKDESKRPLVHLLQEISESKPIMASSSETLMQKYMAILTVVALYWYLIILTFISIKTVAGTQT